MIEYDFFHVVPLDVHGFLFAGEDQYAGVAVGHVLAVLQRDLLTAGQHHQTLVAAQGLETGNLVKRNVEIDVADVAVEDLPAFLLVQVDHQTAGVRVAVFGGHRSL